MARKAKGEGSLYPYRDGYRAAITIKGKRRYFYFANVTKAEAGRQLRERLNQRDDGTLPRGADLTLTAWMRHWVKTADLSPASRYNYERNIERYIVPTIGHIRLSDLEPEDLEGLYEQLATGALSRDTTTPLSPRSIRNVHANIRAALNKAVKRRHVARNVALAVELDSAASAEMKVLSAADARALMDVAMRDRLAARWFLGLGVGMRPAEVLGLAWSNVDLPNKVIRVRQQLQRVAGLGVILVPKAKTDAGRRDIQISDRVVTMLEAVRDEQMRNRVHHGTNYTEWEFDGEPAGLVFTQRNGKPIDIAVDTRNWQALLDAAGLPRERRYIARHTAASIMIDMGIDIAVVSSMLGHKKTSFTYDTYVHPLDEAKRDAADKLGALYDRA
jgi:integrase